MKIIQLDDDERPGKFNRRIMLKNFIQGNCDPAIETAIKDNPGYTTLLWKNRKDGSIIYII
jgi:hypothetical protein